MPKQLHTSKGITGLNLISNRSNSSPGSLSRAENVVFRFKDTASKRLGFNYHINTAANTTALHNYKDHIIISNEDGTLQKFSNSLQTFSGLFQPASERIRFVNNNGVMFFTENEGIFRLSGIENNPVKAGVPFALDVRLNLTGQNGFLQGDEEVAYQVVWQRTDELGLVTRSAPSPLMKIKNDTTKEVASLTRVGLVCTVTTSTNHNFVTGDQITINGASDAAYNITAPITVTNSTTFTYNILAGSPTSPATGTIKCFKRMNVELSFPAPEGITTNDSYEIYRSDADIITDTSALYFIQTSKYNGTSPVVYTDNYDDILLQNFLLYTAPNSEGISSANYPPPKARYLTNYEDCVFYANVEEIPTIQINILGVASLQDNISNLRFIRLSDNNTLTYTYSTTEDVATRKFQRYTTFPVAANNIEQTAKSLIRVINSDPTGWLYAQYVSQDGSNPGQIRIYARNVTHGLFSIQSTNPVMYDPQLPTSGNSTRTANNVREDLLYFSKPNNGDAVPLVNFISPGGKDEKIMGIISNRDSLFCFTNKKLYQIFGNYPNFSVRERDASVGLIAPDSLAISNNLVYGLTNKGFIAATDSGVEIISGAIQPEMDKLINTSQKRTFAVTNDQQHIYCCWIAGDNQIADYCFVFDVFEKQWTTWTKRARCGLSFDNNFYISSNENNKILKQRNNNLITDYRDEEYPITIIYNSPGVVTFTTTEEVTEGWGITQGDYNAKIISYVKSGNTYTATLHKLFELETGNAILSKPIPYLIQTNVDFVGMPAAVKNFYELQFQLKKKSVSSTIFSLKTNQSAAWFDAKNITVLSEGFGVDSWGIIWGSQDPELSANSIREIFANQRNTGESFTSKLSHNVCFEEIDIINYTLVYEGISEVNSQTEGVAN